MPIWQWNNTATLASPGRNPLAMECDSAQPGTCLCGHHAARMPSKRAFIVGLQDN